MPLILHILIYTESEISSSDCGSDTLTKFPLSAHVSPRTIHFQVLDKSPVWGPGRGPPSCNTTILTTPVRAKIAFHRTGPWCPKGWGPLT